MNIEKAKSDTDWYAVADAVREAIDNGEGRAGPGDLQYAFEKLGLTVAHVDEEPAQIPEPATIERCLLPPEGWWCSREPGHEGPCAARPEEEWNIFQSGWQAALQSRGAAVQGEAVAWQANVKGSDSKWTLIAADRVEEYKSSSDWVVRPLFAAPQPDTRDTQIAELKAEIGRMKNV